MDNSKMNAIIIDDNKNAIINLSKYLEPYEDINVVATAETGAEGLKAVKEHGSELIFLDVELPDIDGTDFIEKIKQMSGNGCRVVIYTAYDRYMLSAFRNKAFDFLLKPVDKKELNTIINRVRKDIEDEKDGEMKKAMDESPDDNRLLVYTNTIDFKLLWIKDICAFAYDHTMRLWTAISLASERPMRLKRHISKDFILAIDDCFIQVSQKYIININYLMEVCDNICYFYPPFDAIDYINVGRTFRRDLIKRYNSI